MKKVFDFIESLSSEFYDLLGYPTIKVFYDYVEVYFDSSEVFRSTKVFDLTGYDEFLFFAQDRVITFVFTFYK